ncbi:MAG: cupredoxin domain-containing protein [Nitrosarchaeum sp.]
MVKQKPKTKLGRNTIFVIICIVVLGSVGGYYAINSMIPVNSTTPVFGAPANYYVKTLKSANGHVFTLTSTKGGKKSFTPTKPPIISVSRGELISFHLINEDSQKHNLNLDEFNVHTKDLDYFESQSITFIADKTGQFTFHCTLNPEMTGTFTVK